MEGFGEIFKAIGEMFGAVEELGAAEVVREAVSGDGHDHPSTTETYDRVLTGAKRTPNINDR